MTFSGKSLTIADIERRRLIHAGNCMACEVRGIEVGGTGYVQWHHLAGKKRHDLTIGLCQWHHQGRPPEGWSHESCREHFGPSLAEGSKPFHAAFGSDEELLQRQNQFLQEAGFEVSA